jgi:hypothetical protein
LASTVLLAAVLVTESSLHVHQAANLFVAAWHVWALAGLRCSRLEIVVAAVLGVTSPLLTLAVPPAETSLALALFEGALWAAQSAWVAWLLLRHLFSTVRVTLDEFAGAVAAYMFIGFAFANLQGLIFLLDDQSLVFNYLEPGARPEFSHVVYFSFVTLATLGYGDVAPGNHVARLLAVLESIIGLMYMAILVARLVGLHTATQTALTDQSDG